MADVFYKIKATVSGQDGDMNVPIIAGKVEHPLVLNVDGTKYSYNGSEDLGEITITSGGSGGTTGDYDSTLANNTYQQIRNASDAGIASSIWEVGETLPVQLTGTIGMLDIDQLLYIYIIGFDHNPTLEGVGVIHFQGFKNADGVSVCLIDSAYTYGYTNGAKYFNMNHWGNYNYGGWAPSDARYDVLGSTDIEPSGYGARRYSGDVGYNPTSTCATNPVPDTLMSCLPEDLRLVMKPLTKYTDNVAGGSGSVDGNISPTKDYLPLLSEFELFGTQQYANSYEQDHQKEYDYYINGNLQQKYRHSSPSSTAYYWDRSPCYYTSNYFCYVLSSGSRSWCGANFSIGLAPALGI